MIDSVQVILLFVIIILTILLVALGIQVFFILREVKRTVTKANKVLDDTSMITESVSRPLSSIATIAMGFKAGSLVSVFKLLKNFLSKDEEEKTRHAER